MSVYEHNTQSKYKGNAEQCPGCAVTYGGFKTGLTYYEVWMLLWDPPDTCPTEWKYKRRGTVLGKWFSLKQESWAKHIEECGQELPDEEIDLNDAIALDDPDLSDCPF